MKWEYRVIDTGKAGSSFVRGRSVDQVEEYLNQFGAEGWEIVAADYRELERQLKMYCVAKRPVP